MRDHRDVGGYDVGRIEPSAEPDFDDGDIDTLAREHVERDGRRRLEE
jgi:hypothetical protein